MGWPSPDVRRCQRQQDRVRHSLVVRYLLEVAGTVADAVTAVSRIPVSMSHNLTLTDRTGDYRTVYLAHPVCSSSAIVRWRPITGSASRRMPRTPGGFAVWAQAHLRGLLADQLPPDQVAEEFLRPPLRSPQYANGFGTLYTAGLPSGQREVHYRWPAPRGADGSVRPMPKSAWTCRPPDDRKVFTYD